MSPWLGVKTFGLSRFGRLLHALRSVHHEAQVLGRELHGFSRICFGTSREFVKSVAEVCSFPFKTVDPKFVYFTIAVAKPPQARFPSVS